ncbi:SPW repeat protein [Haladaptatus pallidirubidus]|uniref:SPW repeat-containing integral membrane domain-containing protein n=2 Tax=Haladaptatus pallidirubidus TaxID=1008152 RepID=A0AAV3UIL1_9EURY|nr:SPW repeat protein [Haladaptatus pallidirubidus]
MSNHDTDREQMHNQDRHAPNPDERGKGLSALIALLGLWLILQAFLFELAATQVWNDVLVGAFLAAIGVYNYSRQSNKQLGSMGAAIVATILGLWLIIAPFVLGIDAGATETANDLGFWNDIIVGLLAFVLGAYSAYKIRDWRQDAQRPTA